MAGSLDAVAGRGAGTLADLLRLGRPHFLVGGVAMVALGVVLAWSAGARPHALDVALAQALVTLTQWGVHYLNEAHDVDADRANWQRTRLAGGTGLIVHGRVAAGDALRAAHVLFAAGVLAAAALALRAPASLLVSVPMVVLAWAYSAPPLRLCSRGLGELATGLIVGLLVPAAVLVPGGVALAPWPWLLLAPLAVQVAALVTVLSLPDVDGDEAAGKRTLAVRLGGKATRRLVRWGWIACGLASMAAVLWGAPAAWTLAGGAAYAAAVALPMLVLRQRWDALAVVALAVVALQWALTAWWALSS